MSVLQYVILPLASSNAPKSTLADRHLGSVCLMVPSSIRFVKEQKALTLSPDLIGRMLMRGRHVKYLASCRWIHLYIYWGSYAATIMLRLRPNITLCCSGGDISDEYANMCGMAYGDDSASFAPKLQK